MYIICEHAHLYVVFLFCLFFVGWLVAAALLTAGQDKYKKTTKTKIKQVKSTHGHGVNLAT